jgi:hypothetical protein
MAEKAKPKKKLSIREKRFIKALIKGEPPTTAMKTAGYTEYTANCKAGKKVRESKIQETLQELMIKNGLDDNQIMNSLTEGLKATKVISATIMAKNGEGMKDADSMSKDFIDVEDYAVRHKYLETELKLKGHLTEKIDLSGSVSIEIVSYRGVSGKQG